MATRTSDATACDLTKEQEALSKKINKKVMNMLDKAEQEYTELVNKRKTVESDKVKIQKVIAELDVKKNQALQVRLFGFLFYFHLFLKASVGTRPTHSAAPPLVAAASRP